MNIYDVAAEAAVLTGKAAAAERLAAAEERIAEAMERQLAAMVRLQSFHRPMAEPSTITNAAPNANTASTISAQTQIGSGSSGSKGMEHSVQRRPPQRAIAARGTGKIAADG